MKKIWLIVATFLGSTSLAEVKPFMDQMLDEIFNLKPYIVSAEAYKDPKNEDQIKASLKHMHQLSHKINHEGRIKETGFQISGQVLTQQLNETEIIFEAGNKDYSLWMLKSTLGLCMSCHTQLPAVSTKFKTYKQGKVLVNPFEEAEFLFIVRNFDEALKLYAEALQGYPKNLVTPDDLQKILYRQLFYYVRVKRDLASLERDMIFTEKNRNLPKGFLSEVKILRSAAKKMKGEPYPSFTEGQTKELRKYVETAMKTELSGSFSLEYLARQINNLKVSSVLYEYLDLYPDTTLKPDILYWIAMTEGLYSNRAFYSLPELYLKKCVVDFPASKVAPLCLKEYQDLVTMSYTGSSGTHLPADVKKELKTMDELVKKTQSK